MVIENFLENAFEATLSSKTDIIDRLKRSFTVFCKFLSDQVATIFWKSEADCSKLFKSKFDDTELVRKMFQNYLEPNNKSYFCKSLKEHVETMFWESEAKHSKLFKSNFGHRKLLRRWFEWRSWGNFQGKWRKAFKTT